MIRALYTAASGMVTQSLKQDVIANNIANAQTSGFKKERVVSWSFAEALDNTMGKFDAKRRPAYANSPVAGVTVTAEESADDTQGQLTPTGNNLDFAIDGPGSFELQTASGTKQTRQGNFMVNSSNQLCTMDGSLVLGQSGPIQIPEGKWDVGRDGTINVDGYAVDTIKISGADPTKTQLLQGHLENANVSIVTEMVGMIANMRSYEANQKVVQSIDHTLDKLINEAGKV